MVAPVASLVLALGCAGDGSEPANDAPSKDSQPEVAQPTDAQPKGARARAVARNLAAVVKDMDGGTLTDITCEQRPTELENSTQWECRCMRRDMGGTGFLPAVYSAQARPDGEINNVVLKSPR